MERVSKFFRTVDPPGLFGEVVIEREGISTRLESQNDSGNEPRIRYVRGCGPDGADHSVMLDCFMSHWKEVRDQNGKAEKRALVEAAYDYFPAEVFARVTAEVFLEGRHVSDFYERFPVVASDSGFVVTDADGFLILSIPGPQGVFDQVLTRRQMRTLDRRFSYALTYKEAGSGSRVAAFDRKNLTDCWPVFCRRFESFSRNPLRTLVQQVHGDGFVEEIDFIAKVTG